MTPTPGTSTSLDTARKATRRIDHFVEHLQSAMRLARSWRVTLLLGLVALSILSAISVQKTDALTAWESWLHLHFGYVLPLLCLALSFRAMSPCDDPSNAHFARIRLGADRLYLTLTNLGVVLVGSSAIGAALLLLGRFLTRGTGEAVFLSDFAVCIGIGLIATATYIIFFSAMQRLGRGRTPAIVAFAFDLTVGHSDGAWALFTPHRYLEEMLGSPGIFLVSARASSWILLSIMLAGIGWIVARTRR